MTKPTTGRRTRLGRGIEETFVELAAGLRGEVELDAYGIAVDTLTPSRIQTIRRGWTVLRDQ